MGVLSQKSKSAMLFKLVILTYFNRSNFSPYIPIVHQSVRLHFPLKSGLIKSLSDNIIQAQLYRAKRVV